MKRYITKCLIAACLVAASIAAVYVVKTVTLRNTSWSLEPGVHIVFAGASHVFHGIDDRMYAEIINVGDANERYMFTYLKLKYLLRDNPSVDTVVLQCAPTDLWEDTDAKYFQEPSIKSHLPYYWPLFGWEEWKAYADCPDALTIIMQYLLSDFHKDGTSFFISHGKYYPEQQSLSAEEAAALHCEQMTDSTHTGHAINYRYLGKIKELCNASGVKLFCIYCPVYHPEYFYDQEYYEEAYRSCCRDVPLLDFRDMPLPLDCYMDAHHVNAKGAVILTDSVMGRLRSKKPCH